MNTWKSWLLGPEPYESPEDNAWAAVSPASADGREADASGGQHRAPNSRENTGQKWFVRKKHRKVARMELMDALELRDRLAWGVGAVVLMIFIGAGWGSNILVRKFLER